MAFLPSLIDYRLGLAVCVGVTFLYLLPPRDLSTAAGGA